MIFYFSGTGNSAFFAKRLAEQTGDILCSVNECLKKKRFFSDTSQKKLIFVTPTYAWRIPKVVEQWIMKSEFASNAAAYFLMTCGDAMGNAPLYVQRLCAKKSFTYMGCAELIMPENYIAMFSAPDTEEAKKLIDKALPKFEKLAEKISLDQPFEIKKTKTLDRILSGSVNPIFYTFVVRTKKFQADGRCIGCHKCENICPLNNIKIVDKKPVWGNKCTHCMACITICPTEAIEYGKHSVGQPRYQCPYEK